MVGQRLLEIAQFLSMGGAIETVPVIFAAFAPATEPLLAGVAVFVRAETAGSAVNACLISFDECAFSLTAFVCFHQLAYLCDWYSVIGIE